MADGDDLTPDERAALEAARDEWDEIHAPLEVEGCYVRPGFSPVEPRYVTVRRHSDGTITRRKYRRTRDGPGHK